ncbi:cache domain-containing protein [Fundidesulfovibrio terrae]|uniref:cache domain-containing protein n=1 Tax=Fundidesulfovibrio terrae TaxID=2922866 RepID=UPI001FAEA823|nr:cache domain-containing protein [Fundidesulfovibrio terrae]
MLRRFAISTRLFGLVGLVILFSASALMSTAVISMRLEDAVVHHTQALMLESEKSKIKAAVHSMALTLSEALKLVPEDDRRREFMRNILGPVRFEEDASGYFFVYSGTVNVALPARPDLEGADLGAFTDREGVRYVYELARQAQAGGGFVRYIFPKPSGVVERKLSYAEMIPGTDFWVGTGVYIDNVDREMAHIASFINEFFEKALTASGVLTVTLIAVLCALCLMIAHSVAGPMEEATMAAERIAAGDLNVSLSARGRDEASRLQAALNDMTAILRRNIQEIHARREEAEEKAAQAEQALIEVQKAGREVEAQVTLRIESLQKISSAVAHQLRNPTTIIGGLAGLLMKKPTLKEHYLDYLDGIIDAARRIEHITSAVKEYSSIHLGLARTAPAGRILEDALAAGRECAASLGVPVRWEVEGADVPVFGDQDLLSMALKEVAINAVEALPPDGGSVRLEGRAAGEGSELLVADTGKGIADAELQYLLDPFYTTKSVGVGMGLTKANRAVQEHGGSLSIRSEPGRGTTVSLALPGE